MNKNPRATTKINSKILLLIIVIVLFAISAHLIKYKYNNFYFVRYRSIQNIQKYIAKKSTHHTHKHNRIIEQVII